MTPEQIKAALKCCGDGCAYGCPYEYMEDQGIQCEDQLCKDALGLIESLQGELKEQEERADDHTANPAGRGE